MAPPTERYTGPAGARRLPEWSFCMYVDPATSETCGKADPRIYTRIEIPLEMLRNIWLTEKTEQRTQRISSPAVHPAQRGSFIQMDVVLCDDHRSALAPDAIWFDAASGTVEAEQVRRARHHRINGGGRRPSIEPVPTGTRFGKLTTLEQADRVTAKVRVRCDCGVETTKMLGNMRNGQTQSCGCLQDEFRHRKREGHPWKTTPTP